MSKNNKIGLVIGFIVVAGIFFYGGMKYGAMQRTAAMQAARGSFAGGAGGFGAGRGTRGGAGAAGGFTTGQIISKDATSITISLPAGGSKIIFLGDTTKISKSVSGSSSDLATGTNVMVTGTANPDGSVTADSVQIRPAMPATTAAPATTTPATQ